MAKPTMKHTLPRMVKTNKADGQMVPSIDEDVV